MSIYDRMMKIICSFKAYNKDNRVLQSEMYSFAKGLELISNRLEVLEKECFVVTAEDFGLLTKERYFDSINRADTVSDRRKMLLSILSVDETDFNLDGMKKFISQFPVDFTIKELPTDNKIQITFTKNDWIVNNIGFVKSCVNDFFPSHLEHILNISE